ncbi:S-adenosyl-L-methionine-dependent methyltransferase [Ramaria rubella]|nr:S-adenosyl-L-methionine-dependent methyltransferase [Ramaria rubella]
MAEVDSKSEKTYTLKHASKHPEERTRLDSQHEALIDCLDGKLCLGLEPTESPKRILEIGAGSGVWAILAATTFPDAEIIAVDLAEIPRTLPANVKFIKADVNKPFDFAESASFDLVHSRLTLIHVPNYRDVLLRAAAMVTPGELLSAEDPDFALYNDAGLSHSFKELLNKWRRARDAEGLCFDECKEFNQLLTETGAFTSVDTHKLPVPLWGRPDGSAPERLGYFLSTAGGIMWRHLSDRSCGTVTLDEVEQAIAELNDDGKRIYLDYYYTYARKHL